MTKRDRVTDHLTDYERAICYYTLPSVSSPTTIGLVAAYAVCLLEAIGVLAYGYWRGDPAWTRAGIWALGGIIIFGMAAFLIRAVYNEVRQRRLLAAGRNVRDAIAESGDLPDPFAEHILIRHPRYVPGASFTCTDNHGNVVYTVDSVSQGAWWKAATPEGKEVVRARIVSGLSSFSLSPPAPKRLAVYVGSDEIGRIGRRFSLGEPIVDIRCDSPSEMRYSIRRRCIYRDDRMVGRIYYLRHYIYLDVEKDECHPALLAYFLTMG